MIHNTINNWIDTHDNQSLIMRAQLTQHKVLSLIVKDSLTRQNLKLLKYYSIQRVMPFHRLRPVRCLNQMSVGNVHAAALPDVYKESSNESPTHCKCSSRSPRLLLSHAKAQAGLHNSCKLSGRSFLLNKSVLASSTYKPPYDLEVCFLLCQVLDVCAASNPSTRAFGVLRYLAYSGHQ